MKKIALIGASGSIGTQTIDVIKNNTDKFKLVSFSVGKNVDYANEILNLFDDVELVCVQNKDDIEKVKKGNYKIVYGERGLLEVAITNQADVLVTAVVGFIGLKPTIAAIKAKKDIALANKETLVTAGHIIMPMAKEYGVSILPVDSEHSAIYQCLNGENQKEINKLIITASGGSFRDKTREELADVTVKEALNHPNWSMGAKITIDSATMFNKGLEIIEAHHLFDVEYDNIDVLIHRQSIVHSMIEFDDYSIMAQLGGADMRLPIQYALTYPTRQKIVNSEPINLAKIGTLDFKDVDIKRYPAVGLAFHAGKIGGSLPTVLNAANEVAVSLFLDGKIKFLDIETIVIKAMENHKVFDNPSIDEIIEIDQITRDNIVRDMEDIA